MFDQFLVIPHILYGWTLNYQLHPESWHTKIKKRVHLHHGESGLGFGDFVEVNILLLTLV